MTVIDILEQYVWPFLQACATLLFMLPYPKDLWTKFDRTFGKHNEDHNRNLEITPNTTVGLYSKLSASILSYEFVQDEEEAESSTHSIRIEESLVAVTPSPTTLDFYEISYISSSHIVDLE